MKEDKCWNTVDLEGHGSLGVLVHIHFDHFNAISFFVGQPFQLGSHHLTGTAPFGEKIYQNRTGVSPLINSWNLLIILF
jgi:hypothetical protein